MSSQHEMDEAKAKFSMLSILLVEDSSFMRLLISGLLRSYGITQVYPVENGAEAIKWMETKSRTLPPGQTPCDMVMCDMVMPEVDGLMFLKWLRGSKKSPDKFMPAVMISGAVDLSTVGKARDVGASEFLAKPFSTATVWDRLMHTIFKPRKFVLCPTYFGPDRRRFEGRPPAEGERRKRKKSEIQILHSRSKGFNNDKDAVFMFDLPNKLASKFGGTMQDIPDLDPGIFREAEAKIENMAGDYAVWVRDMIKDLEKELAMLVTDDQHIKSHLGKIHDIGHELRGQGGIFGYDLITLVGKSLTEAAPKTRTGKLTENEWKLIKAHIDTVKVVINEQISGNGGKMGQELIASLEMAKQKYSD